MELNGMISDDIEYQHNVGEHLSYPFPPCLLASFPFFFLTKQG
jgi:hypothetical protein